MMPDADMAPARRIRRGRGRPPSNAGLLKMLSEMVADENLRPWTAALKAASLETNNGDYRESVARRLARKLREIKKAYESGAIKDLLDDDMVLLFALFVAHIHGWSSTVTYDGQMAELAIRLLEEAELKLEIRLLEEKADRQNFPYLNTKSFP